MCSHPEHRVEVLSDGQIDETHVFSYDEFIELLEKVRELGNQPKPRVLMLHGEVFYGL